MKLLRYLKSRQALLRWIGEAAAQEERNRLARDLHDSIKQQLFSINVSAAAAQERWDRDPEGARAMLADVRRSAKEAMVEMQALLHQLRPEALTSTGLVEALREQCEALGYRTGAEVTLELGEPLADDHLLPGSQETLFRVAQEALSNIARHARARKVRVWMGRDGGAARIWIRDDGQGFDPGPEASGMGLRNIKERTKSLRGNATVASEPGAGTTVDVWIPLTSPQVIPHHHGAILVLCMAAALRMFRPFKEAGSSEEMTSSLIFIINLVNIAWSARRHRQSALEASSGWSQESLFRLRYVSHCIGAIACFLAAGWVPWSWRLGKIWGGWTIAWLVVALLCIGLTCVELVRLYRASEDRRRWWRVSRFKPAGWEWIPLLVFSYALGLGLLLGPKAWAEWLQSMGTLEITYYLLGAGLLLYIRSRRPATEGPAA